MGEVPPERGGFRAGDLVAGHFQIVREIGHGGMGVVYEAVNRLTGERIALKGILPSRTSNQQAIARFVGEINTARRLRHPNIVAVYDVAQEGNRLLFTMEYLDGVSLRRVLAMRGRLPLHEVVNLMRPLCWALEYAHQFMVHRDLSPENVMVTRGGIVKLLDFGLARDIARETLTETGARLGKALYIAPEQRVDAGHVDARADIYALGVMFFELLTGQVPSGYVRLSDLLPEMPAACDQLLSRALAPVDRRFRSAAEFRSALEACLRPQSAMPKQSEATRPESVVRDGSGAKEEAPNRFRGKYRLAVAVLAVATFVTVLAVGAVSWVYESTPLHWGTRETPSAVSSVPSAVPPVPPPAMPSNGLMSQQDDLTGAWEQRGTGEQAEWRAMFATSPVGTHFELRGSGVTLSGTYSLNERSRPNQIDLYTTQVKKEGGWMGIDPPIVLKGVYSVENSHLALGLGLSSLDVFKGYAESFAYLMTALKKGSPDRNNAHQQNIAAKSAIRQLERLSRPESLTQAPGTILLSMKKNPRFENPFAPGMPKNKREALDQMRYPAPRGTVSATWDAQDARAVLHLPGKVDVQFLRVSPGTFTLGIDGDETNRAERPAHQVSLTRGFWLGVYEVNQAQWKAVMEVNPSDIQDDALPVEAVSWEDADLFIRRLNRSGAAHFRLPTEAEWVYACQAGNPVPGQFITSRSLVGDYAWCSMNSASQAHPCGQKQPNAWGFHDMLGNLWEWCGDWFAPEYYANSPAKDPEGPTTGSERIALGGSWKDDPALCQTLRRNWFPPNLRRDSYGFRLCAD